MSEKLRSLPGETHYHHEYRIYSDRCGDRTKLPKTWYNWDDFMMCDNGTSKVQVGLNWTKEHCHECWKQFRHYMISIYNNDIGKYPGVLCKK